MSFSANQRIERAPPAPPAPVAPVSPASKSEPRDRPVPRPKPAPAFDPAFWLAWDDLGQSIASVFRKWPAKRVEWAIVKSAVEQHRA